VARLVVLKTRRCLARGEVEPLLHDIGLVLRLARDLRPRGSVISQVVATAITNNVTGEIIPVLLASPAFRDEHARQLLDLLVRHESASIDGYQEGLRFEYLVLRKALPQVAKDPRKIGQALLGDSLLRQVFTDASKAPGKIGQAVREFQANGDQVADEDAFGRLLELEIKSKPSLIAAMNTRVDDYLRDLLAFRRPVTQRPEQLFDPSRIDDGSFYSKVVIILLPPAQSIAQIQARAELTPRAAECLIALKLWKRRWKEAPTDLEAVVKAAGLPRVPIDPYSGQPLRMAIIDGEPVIYSIGKDGRDDGGRIDSNADRKPGDQTFRLPTVKERKP
jgi:hypothetical protein